MKVMMKSVGIAAAAAAVGLAACSDSTDPGTAGTATVSLRAARVGIVAASENVGYSVTTSDGTNTVIIQSVSLTLQDIDMERTSQSVDCTDGASSSEDCSDWIDGPVRVNLNLTNASQGQNLSIPLQEGTYDVISFDITVPDGGDPAEVTYNNANPDLAGGSVLVTGTYNGQPFSFKTALTGDREVALVPPLVVTGSGVTDFSFGVEFDVAMWFRRDDGSIIDPRTTSTTDREIIRQNIRDHIESESIP